MTAGFDGSVHLYHSLKQQHLLEVVPTEGPLHVVQWSPFRPLVFAAAAGESESRTEGVVFSDTVGDCPTVYGCIAGPDSPRCFCKAPLMAFNFRFCLPACTAVLQVTERRTCTICSGPRAWFRPSSS